MGLVRRERRMTAEDAINAYTAQRLGNMGAPYVTAETAYNLSAVWACIRLIAGVGSTLPIDVIRGTDQLSAPLFEQPDPAISLTSWLYQVWTSLLTAGNAYAIVTGIGVNGWPRNIEVLDPSIVTWSYVDDRWVAMLKNQPVGLWPNGPLWHVPLFLRPGCPEGQSPIAAAQQAISTGLAAERFGSQFFTDGGIPNAVIYSDQPLSAEQSTELKVNWTNATRGNREPAVMGSGLKYERISVAPNEAQFIESQRFTVEQVARIYGVPPEMIGGATSGSSVTYTNRDQRAEDWLAYGLMPYLLPLETALTALLPKPQRVRFNVDGILRADLASRYQSYKIAGPVGLLSINEMRAYEDLPPVPGGDSHDPYKLVKDPAPGDATNDGETP